MKNNCLSKCSIIVFIVFSCALASLSLGSNQDQEHEKIVEKVTVTNVEVPVRVLYKGKPVEDLTKEDFTLYENKKKLPINGFFLKRKKIKISEAKEIEETKTDAKEVKDVEENKEILIPPRTFVFVFSVTDFNKNLTAAIDYAFEKVLRKNDRLLIFANNKTREYPRVREKQKIKNELLQDLEKEGRKARRRLINYIHKVEAYLDMHDFRVRLFKRQDLRPQRMIQFLRKYLITWNEYKKNYLTPSIDRFYFFSKYLENIKTEKWVLNFYQFELFPKIRMGSRTMFKLREVASTLTRGGDPTSLALGKRMTNLINQVYTDLNVPQGFPVEEVSKLFYKVDATFHSFFIRSTNKAHMNDFDFLELSSDLEQTLKAITDVTGGKNITSNNLVKSLETVQELEDVYYILTYVPLDPKKTGKLKIKVKSNGKRYKVLYDNNFRADYISEYLENLEKRIEIPGIKIEDFSFKGKILAFTVKDFLMKESGKNSEKVGKMKVRIRVTDKSNKSLWDQAKVLTARKAEMKISLDAFKKIIKGEYNFLVDAVDMFTGKEANIHQNITIK